MWRSQMRKPSYKGVSFGVNSDKKQGGRTTIIHEFPGREPYIEDMGPAPQQFSLQAFVLGSDYMSQRDALEEVLNEPGPGTLVHPWYGELQVSLAAPYEVQHSDQNGGMCVFALHFAVDNPPTAPSASVNQQVVGMDRAGLSGLLACNNFDAAFSLAGEASWVIEEGFQSVQAAVGRVQAALGGDITEIAGFLGATTGFDLVPWVSVGQSLWGVFQNLAGSSKNSANSATLAGRWLNVAAAEVPVPMVDNPGLTRSRVAANDLAVNSLTRHLAMVEAAKNMLVAVPESRGQAFELREQFMDVLDSVFSDEAGSGGIENYSHSPLPADLFEAFTDLRASTLRTLAQAARSAPDVINYTPNQVLPSLVLAYNLSGSIELEPDFVARNRVIHPAFVPVDPLEVLINAK